MQEKHESLVCINRTIFSTYFSVLIDCKTRTEDYWHFVILEVLNVRLIYSFCIAGYFTNNSRIDFSTTLLGGFVARCI